MMQVEICCPYDLVKANPTDVGYDLRSMEEVTIYKGGYKLIDTGCSIKITKNKPSIPAGKFYQDLGMDIQVRGRSSLAAKGILTHFGTIDETYQSPIKVLLYNFGFNSPDPYMIEKGDKIAQLVFSTFIPTELIKVTNLEENRGGFGSSGK